VTDETSDDFDSCKREVEKQAELDGSDPAAGARLHISKKTEVGPDRYAPTPSGATDWPRRLTK
jgi:hypothetical protein